MTRSIEAQKAAPALNEFSRVFEHSNFRSYLKSVLVERKQKRSSYSLRAMARDLDLLPSHLSAINTGSKSLSIASAHQVARKLKLTHEEAEYFVLLVQIDAATDLNLKGMLITRANSLRPVSAKNPEVIDLSVDVFKALSDWYHIPLLEMTALDTVSFEPIALAKKLGITALEAEVAIERLIRLDLLEIDAKGKAKKIHDNYVFKAKVPTRAFRDFHRTMLQKASDSLETQGHDERYVCANTISIDSSQIPEAVQLIEEFRSKLVALFDCSKKRDQTYQLGVQLFNLTPTTPVPKEKRK